MSSKKRKSNEEENKIVVFPSKKLQDVDEKDFEQDEPNFSQNQQRDSQKLHSDVKNQQSGSKKMQNSSQKGAQNQAQQFKDEESRAEDAQGEVTENFNNVEKIRLPKNKLLIRNCSLVNIEKNKISHVDILIEGEKIVKIAPPHKIDPQKEYCDLLDVNGDYVIGGFVDWFSHDVKAFEQSYGKKVCNFDSLEDLNSFYLISAGLLSGINVRGDKKVFLLDNIAEKSEKELSEISMKIAKQKRWPVIVAGRDLEELGKIDNMFHKPLSRVLEDFGFLDRGFMIVGGNCFDKDDWEIFSQYDGSCAVCPVEDAIVGRRPVNFQMLKNLGVEVLLSAGYVFERDMFSVMRHALASQRCMFESSQCITEQDVMKMCVPDSRWVLREGDLANLLVIRRGTTLCDDVCKDIVWTKNNYEIGVVMELGHILQFAGVCTKFAEYSDQVRFLKAAERKVVTPKKT